ncbi:Nup85 nucleoporin-domain-containing protein [Panaeolus papilionaceus]|nr:Nup85 nucleoporin-domain-containing protein [Panaeolus papilionaceus]
MTSHLNLAPVITEPGKFDELVKHGITLSTSLSPADNSFCVYPSPAVPGTRPTETDRDLPTYFASLNAVPSSERRLFLTDTLIIFSAFQNLLKSGPSGHSEWLESEETLTLIRKLAIDYVNFIKECWVHASQPISRPEPLQYTADHYRSLYTCFSLFVVLYLPEPGYEMAPVGDELMEWLNTHFIEPSTEEGDQLSGLEKPWEDEGFWPYLTRSILRGLTKASLFFLGSLEQHPSEDLQRLTSALIPLVESQPRLINFTAERDFAYAMRRWHDKIKALRLDLNKIPEDDRYDDFDNWWDKLSDIVGVLEGRSEVLQRVCEDLGADWKEMVVAWTIFVDPRLRRQEVPDVVFQIISELPPDPTDLEDMIHVDLFSGQSVEALEHCLSLDPWIAAHLADIMEPMQIIDRTVDEESQLTTRDRFVLEYAEYLHSDPALWRITVDYMYTCNDIGKARADEVLLRVPLRLQEQNFDRRVDSRIRAGEIVGVFKDVNKTCFDYKRENVRRTVCRILAAQTLVADKDYGLAVSYCISAEDWRGLGRVVDRVLEEYITSGSQKFTQYALAIAPSVQEIRAQSNIQGIFVHRLVFTVRYARFHDLLQKQEYADAASDLISIFSEEVAPTAWWATVLYDSIPLLKYTQALLFSTSGATMLLHKLEEVFTMTSQGMGDEYLSIFIRTVQARTEKDALERLKAVRLALAVYFSRCLVLGQGGK